MTYCGPCNNAKAKANRLKRMAAAGKEPKRVGKSPYCYWCKALKERPQSGLCNSCRAEEARQYRAKKREELGIKPRIKGGNPNCACGALKDNPKDAYCKPCKNRKYKEANERRMALGLPSYNESRSAHCYGCGILKENPKKAYCYKCTNEKERARTLARGIVKKHRTGKCACGEDFCSYSRHQCAKCHNESRKKKLQEDSEAAFKEFSRTVTKNAIKKGFLVKQPCVICNTNEDVEAHHEDYTKPLDVVWLCRLHHMQHHAGKISLNKD